MTGRIYHNAEPIFQESIKGLAIEKQLVLSTSSKRKTTK